MSKGSTSRCGTPDAVEPGALIKVLPHFDLVKAPRLPLGLPARSETESRYAAVYDQSPPKACARRDRADARSRSLRSGLHHLHRQQALEQRDRVLSEAVRRQRHGMADHVAAGD